MDVNYLPFERTLHDDELSEAVKSECLIKYGHEEAHAHLVIEKARRFFSESEGNYRIIR